MEVATCLLEILKAFGDNANHVAWTAPQVFFMIYHPFRRGCSILKKNHSRLLLLAPLSPARLLQLSLFTLSSALLL